jgi:hypothetical protein
MKFSRLASMCLIAAVLGAEPLTPARSDGSPSAPIGHRQPNARNVPADDSVEGGALGAAATNSFGPALMSLPKLDLRATCRRAQPLVAGEEDAYQSCLTDEVGAQKELSHKWFSFRAEARAICTRETQIGGDPSFVELITCLELDQQATQSRTNNAKPMEPASLPAVSTTPHSSPRRALSRN